MNAAFEAGRLQGIAEERSRVKALLDLDLTSASTPTSRRPRSTVSRSTYGNVINIVRAALRDIGEAVDAAGMADLVGSGITPKQSRNALRQLVRNGEATSAARGKFLWRESSESAPAGKPGDDAPGPFSLAAA